MSKYISSIHIEELRHLHNIDILLSEDGMRHLLITGKNGSGKTTLLDGIARYLEELVNRAPVYEKSNLENAIATAMKNLENAIKKGNKVEEEQTRNSIGDFERNLKKYYGEVELCIADEASFKEDVKKGNMIIAYYKDDRNPRFIEPKSPELPEYSHNIKITNDSKDNQFLKLLVHYKVQGAIESLEGNRDKAGTITSWFNTFKGILRKLFNDPQLDILFNPKDYTFTICDGNGKKFRFTQLPAGYRAALDIISDLIFKMQSKGQINQLLDQEGIVLIDEVETHLHLSMQKEIMPILTTVFPKIQFVVSTHSPFVLSSIGNAVAVDLERPNNIISDLTAYSYEALAEGYFGVVSSSSDIQDRLNELYHYVIDDNISNREAKRRDRLITDFERVPEALAPSIVGRFKEIMILYHSKKTSI